MSEFEAKVYKLTIEEHPNADALELAVVGDYRSIVRKGDFKTGDLGVYIPEAAVCPEWLIKELGLEGRLAGKKHNRVKAVKLRGVLSQGLIYPLQTSEAGVTTINFDASDVTPSCPYGILPVEEGADVTELLGITKYEPVIPAHMNGEVFSAHGKTLSYDIENFKKYPDVIEDGEFVVMTEKIHGTWCCFGYHPDLNVPIITSKGLSGRGLAFKMVEANYNNLYYEAFVRYNYRDVNRDKLFEMFTGTTVLDRAAGFWGAHQPFYILGEIYGQGVQDLGYGTKHPHFRVFDIYWGEPGKGRYADADSLQSMCRALEMEPVPELYKGPFSKEKMEELTNGTEMVSGEGANMREGIVIRPIRERDHLELGRVILKSVSEAYLLRKGGTEFN